MEQEPKPRMHFRIVLEGLYQMADTLATFQAPICTNCNETLPLLIGGGARFDVTGASIQCDLCGHHEHIDDDTPWEDI